MCGRYFIDEDSNEELLNIIRTLNHRLQNKALPVSAHVKSGEIFPSDLVPVITKGSNSACYQSFAWGFKNPVKKNLIINARQETVLSKPMFSNSILNHRIVIPSSGFFEWSHDNKKQKYFFTSADSSILYMAGIARYDSLFPQFVILTTSANQSMKPIHDRMPILLKKEEVCDYINQYDYANHILHREVAPLNCVCMHDTAKKDN